MSIDRRHFLFQAGASIATAATLGASGKALGSSVGSTFITDGNEPLNWAAVRGQFDSLSRAHIHLSSFFLVSHPRIVREEIEKHRRAIDDNPYVYIEKNMFEMPGRIQASAAEYLGGKSEEVAVTNSTTMGLALVYHGLPIKTGQEILTTTHDHFVHHESIRLAAERAGASFKKIALFDDIEKVSEEDIVSRIKKAITPKTRVVGITWVHSSSGLKLPLRAISDAVAEANKNRADADRIFVIVDGVHGLGVENETIAETGVDFFIAGTHKWMFGPRGTGVVWGKAENWKTLRMVFPSFAPEPFSAWMMDAKLTAPTQASWVTQGGFHAFEYEWALPAAFAFHKQIGRARIAERIHSLNDQCKEGLAAMPHIKLYTPRGNKLSAGLVSFDVKGIKAEEVVKKLLAKGVIASTSPYRNSCARLAPSLLNTPEEIEMTLRYIRALS